MSRSAGQELPVAFDGAQRRRGERIPGAVWRSVVSAAQRHGVHRVSRALGLDYVHLKRRVAEATPDGDGGCGSGVFVEVDGSAVANGAACVVELAKGNGTRMRICVRDGAAVDWCRLKEAFLGA
jgi:hypothetical protein